MPKFEETNPELLTAIDNLNKLLGINLSYGQGFELLIASISEDTAQTLILKSINTQLASSDQIMLDL